MKKHNIIKVVLVTILILLILTWILPAAYFSSGEYVDQGRVQMGLFDLFNYPLTALSYFGYIALFIILVGGFYGILYKIPAYRTFLDTIVDKFKGSKEKEFVVLFVIISILAFLTSFCGLNIGLILFVPLIVSVILLMGYDKFVAALVTVGSISVGLSGSTFANANLATLLESLSLKLDYNIGSRFFILVVGIVLVAVNVYLYVKNTMSDVKIQKKTVKKVEDEKIVVESISDESKKIKKKTTTTKSSSSKSSKSKSTSKSSKTKKNANKAALRDEDIIVVRENVDDDFNLIPESVDLRHTIWPFVICFSLLFVLFCLAFIAWGQNGFGVKFFDDITSNVTKFELFGFPIFAKILGTVNSFGNWSISDLFLPMFIVILLLVLIYKVEIDDVFDGFMNGVKRAIVPAMIVVLLYSILVLVTYHPFQLFIYKTFLGSSKSINVLLTSIVAILASLFNSDIVYSFQSVVPYYASVVKVDDYSLAGVIFQSMYGVTMLVAPTSLILMTVLSYLGISYSEWLKNVWKLLLELFIIFLIIFIVLARI